MENREILKQGSIYANKQWKVLEHPNEHDNSRDDFIAGAMWMKKQIAETDHLLEQRDELIACLSFCSDFIKDSLPHIPNHMKKSTQSFREKLIKTLKNN